MNKVEVRAIIKYFCMKDISPTEIQNEHFIKTLGDESPYSTINKWAAEIRGGGWGEG